MSPTLKVIALISGGKDSLFNLLHCIHHDHQIVALANLHPKAETSIDAGTSSEDIDSFMYQTVGHSVIPLYATALSLPLYRRAITGNAIQTAREYTYIADSLDETEDLFALLQEVKSDHPDANAVCSGAILSNYQRTRVESVALRLDLTPLSYLWQYPILGRAEEAASDSGSVTGLLDDMAAAGCEARIVKVASGGLDEGLLWADVCDTRTRQRLVRGLTRFVEAEGEDGMLNLKGAVLGEGGEYETLALRGPACLWKYAIQVDPEARTVVQGEGGTSSLVIRAPKLVPQDRSRGTDNLNLHIPTLLSKTFSAIQFSFPPSSPPPTHSSPSNPATRLLNNNKNTHPPSILTPRPSIFHHPPTSTLYISNLLPPSPPNEPPPSQIHSLLTHLLHLLTTYNTSASSILHTTILLRSMSLFPLLNTLYSTLLPLSDPLPPSRVTLSVGDLLPQGYDVSMSFVVSAPSTITPTNPETETQTARKRKTRKGLHVQSRSYWAPANIGPYSQAIAQPLTIPPSLSSSSSSSSSSELDAEIVYLAGQIPLVPATMTPLPLATEGEEKGGDESERSAPFIDHALLALHHLWRVGRAMGVRWWVGGGVAFLAGGSGEGNGNGGGEKEKVMESRRTEEKVRAVAWAWKGAHERRRGRVGEEDDNDDGQEEGEEEEADIWDQRFNRYHHHPPKPLHPTPHPFNDEANLPDWSIIEKKSPASSKTTTTTTTNPPPAPIPPLFIVQVHSLPRDCPIEWSSLGLSLPHPHNHNQDSVRVRVRTERSSGSGYGYSCVKTQVCVVAPAGGAKRGPSTTTTPAATHDDHEQQQQQQQQQQEEEEVGEGGDDAAAMEFTALSFYLPSSHSHSPSHSHGHLNPPTSSPATKSTTAQTLHRTLKHLQDLDSSRTGLREVVHISLYIPNSNTPSPSPSSSPPTPLKEVIEALEKKWPGRTQIFPCYKLWDGEGRGLALGVVVRSERRRQR